MGIMMFMFYFGFVAISLALTYKWVSCPVEIGIIPF
jgi:hypothetical protein